MEWFEAVILGLLKGLTEFLPVSSSGHLEIGKVLLGVETTDDLLFTTMVHAATVLSTIVVFRKQIWDLLSGFFCGLKGLKIEKDDAGSCRLVCNDQTDYLLKLVVSMIPVFVVGPRKASYSVSFVHRIFLLSSPHTIVLDISD